MDERALTLLNNLASACKTKLTPESWVHLHQFILYIHLQQLQTHPDSIRSLLILRGCSVQKASWILQQYQQGLSLLQLYDAKKQEQGKPSRSSG
jgi:hypothetical protein